MHKISYYFLLLFFVISCKNTSTSIEDTHSKENNNTLSKISVDVVKVSISKNAESYTFSVSLRSDETGCKQYANWWEILDKEGLLRYRRILGHSHPTEQPFTRSGTLSDINEEEILFIRGHLNSVGYIGDIFKGSIKNGFSLVKNPILFSEDIELQEPLPSGCAF